jgi:hypothetical protein
LVTYCSLHLPLRRFRKYKSAEQGQTAVTSKPCASCRRSNSQNCQYVLIRLKMSKKPKYICLKESCSECELGSVVTCTFKIWHFIRFYLIAFPAILIGGINLYSFGDAFFYIWFLSIGLFFLLIGIRVLCTHCPHYNSSSRYLKCGAQFGLPKLWKRRPWPMNTCEKAIFIIGHFLIWCYPAIFMVYEDHWYLLTGYVFSVLLFFMLLNRFNCKKCLNFTCPLNAFDKKIRSDYFGYKPGVFSYRRK